MISLMEDALSAYEKFLQVSNGNIEYVSANVLLKDSSWLIARVIG